MSGASLASSLGAQPQLLRPLRNNRLLDSLAKSGRISDARQLFDEMLQRDQASWNILISGCARSGLLTYALSLFQLCPHLNSSTVPWSSLISGFTRLGRPSDALILFRRMLTAGIRPDPFSIGASLRACASLPSLLAGRLAHSLASKSSLDADPFVAAALVDMYSRCGDSAVSAAVFTSVPTDRLSNRILWTAAVTARTHAGDHLGAIRCFCLMRGEGLSPNQFTLPSVLSACASAGALTFGRQTHALAIQIGLAANSFVQSSLVSLYGKCSDLAGANMVLRSAEHSDPVSWNTIIVICSRAALHSNTLSLFVQMRQRDIDPDEFTLPSALNSAAAVGDLHSGSAIHCSVSKTGFSGHQHVGNALVDMYAKCGQMELSLKAFGDLPQRDVVGWTALYNGCARHVSDESALRLYCQMRTTGVGSDEFILSGVLSSCGELALLELGRQIHVLAARLSLDSFRSAGNALISMYAKCGCADEARAVFDSMGRRDAITWTSVIVGYAQNGRGRESIILFDRMVQGGTRPDYVTFIGVLFACSHAGLVEAGRAHFTSMEKLYGVAPGPEHYACMVDLLGRAGRVGEAVELLDKAGQVADGTVWKALLAASRVHRDVSGAERAAKELLRLDPGDAVAYVMLSNVYSRAGKWVEVARVRSMMKARGVNKEPGCSWVEEGGKVHVFHVEERGHPLIAKIYEKMEEMMERARGEGYVADTKWALQDATEEERERGLALHSEKLAVAFGLMGGPKGKPIRVYKNLRICGDCHNAMKIVAKLYERVIVLRDVNCFHHFSAGNCSCSDYW